MYDYGGNSGTAVNNTSLPDLPPSSDIYKGFGAAPNGAVNYVYDFGGTEDKVVLPGESSDYYLDRVDLDDDTRINESLVVYNPTNDTSVFVAGQYGRFLKLDDQTFTRAFDERNSQIEKLVFADTVIDTTT